MPDDAATSPRPTEPEIVQTRRWRPSLVWGIPLVAALIGLGLLFNVLAARGPTITVSFASAEGIEAGTTKVTYRDVDIGSVTDVGLSEDRSRVVATIDLVKEAESFAVEGTRFWVVRPRFAGSGISGIGTLLSGSYIAVDPGNGDSRVTTFTGEEDPPVVPSDVPGRRYVLHADELGSLDIGSPVYFRGIQVGQVERFSLEPDRPRLQLGVFVKAPYDRFVTLDTRFWHASGIDLRMDASGVTLQTQSIATVMLGGVAFEAPDGAPPADPAEEGHTFTLASDHTEAMKATDSDPQTLVLHFDESIRGLSVGAPVDFRGVDIGRIRSMDIVYNDARATFTSRVVVDTYPQRLGGAIATFSRDSTPEARLAMLSELVDRGLRAQLRSGNLFTGRLYVALDVFPEAAPARFDADQSPPELPTVPGDLQALQQQAQAVLQKLSQIPFDTLAEDVHGVLTAAKGTLTRLESVADQVDRDTMPEVQSVLTGLTATVTRLQTLAETVNTAVLPEVVRAGRTATQTLRGIDDSMAGDSPLQQEARQALRAVTEAARSLKALTDSLERNPEALLTGRPSDR
ncbi:MCE family protein [Roseospira marina]|uniref:MCE family protein n=1 Tax=Roseospira marina TaxID=140057 RepID=A0A5M6I8H5_9PROT|nr:MlaD family protein [Roseospira marina]KAA5604049.1 MCE family protein [Roseospira marina]MBB4315843.1 paraquat-inducible protein B [Roseospira marina]MBB5089017.1 paraquat-inducible protein B [Roseospira marina]